LFGGDFFAALQFGDALGRDQHLTDEGIELMLLEMLKEIVADAAFTTRHRLEDVPTHHLPPP